MKTKLLAAVIVLLAAVFCIPLLWRDDPVATPVAAAAVPEPPAQPVASSIEEQRVPAPEPAREAVPAPVPASQPAEVPFDPSPVKVPRWLARFLVVDEDDKPVADATITIWAAQRMKVEPRMQEMVGKGNSYSGHEKTPLLELHSDAEGHASTMLELECLAASASKGDVRTGDTSLWHTRSSTTETKFVLEAPILLRGIVVRADGAPGASAKVIAGVNGGGGLLRGQPPEPEPVVAGADGRFAIPVVRHGGYNLYAELDGARTFHEHRWMRDANPPEVVLVFPGAITLNGIVVDAEGKPVDEAKIKIWREYHVDDPKQDPDDCETADVRSGADGRFSVAVRKHARFQLLASEENHANSDPVWAETTPPRPHAEARLELRRFATIEGVVQHGDGSPFPGVTVLATAPGSPFPSVVGPSPGERFAGVHPARSDTEGRFQLRVHPGTAWSIFARPVAENPTLSFVTKDVAPGRSDVVIVITAADLAGCVVKGSVALADGQPVNDFEVGVVRYDEQGEPSGTTSTKPKFDGNRFELPPMPIGRTIAIQVTPREAGKPRRGAGPFAPTQHGPFVTTSAGLDVPVRIEAWGEQPVQVLAADGAPARRVRASVIRDVNLGSNPSGRPVDTEGKVVLKFCAPGAHKLTVWSDTEKLLEQPLTILPGLNPEVVVRLPATSGAGTGR